MSNTHQVVYGLRDYGTAKWEGGNNPECDHLMPYHSIIPPGRDTTKHRNRQYSQTCEKCGATRKDAQIGLEETPQQYIDKLVTVFRECKRILHPTGTLWLNLGDSYATMHVQGTTDDQTGWKHGEISQGHQGRAGGIGNGIKPKDLLMIPFRVAMAIQQDGWWLRSVIPWFKRSVMPESVTSRPTSAIEYFFLFAQEPKYFYDTDAIRRPNSEEFYERSKYEYGGNKLSEDRTWFARPEGMKEPNPIGRNFRNSDPFFDTWQGLWQEDGEPFALIVNPQGFEGAHFATFPERLCEPCIKAGTSEKGCCPTCKEPYIRIVEIVPEERTEREDKPNIGGLARCPSEIGKRISKGWQQNCKCAPAEPIPCIVLDPFFGSGTVGLVALKNNRKFIGIELNTEYVEMAMKRLKPLLSQTKLGAFL